MTHIKPKANNSNRRIYHHPQIAAPEHISHLAARPGFFFPLDLHQHKLLRKHSCSPLNTASPTSNQFRVFRPTRGENCLLFNWSYEHGVFIILSPERHGWLRVCPKPTHRFPIWMTYGASQPERCRSIKHSKQTWQEYWGGCISTSRLLRLAPQPRSAPISIRGWRTQRGGRDAADPPWHLTRLTSRVHGDDADGKRRALPPRVCRLDLKHCS